MEIAVFNYGSTTLNQSCYATVSYKIKGDFGN